VAKDKKKKPKDKKAAASPSLSKAPKKAVKSLKAISQNPLVADVVAAALIGMAAAVLALGAVYWMMRDQDRRDAAEEGTSTRSSEAP